MSIKPHKLGIIGVGRVGEAVLFDAMASGLFGRIVLIDIKEGLPEGQALDQHHATAVPNMPNTTVIAGDHDDLTDADVIVIAAGPSIDPSKGPATGADRRELAATNGRIIREIMTEITTFTSPAPSSTTRRGSSWAPAPSWTRRGCAVSSQTTSV